MLVMLPYVYINRYSCMNIRITVYSSILSTGQLVKYRMAWSPIAWIALVLVLPLVDGSVFPHMMESQDEGEFYK